MAIRHLQLRVPKYGLNPKLFFAGMMVFFFVIFDGILMYLSPIVMTNAGISESVMGLIIGSSSIAGMLFDFFLCRFLKKTHFRRIFFLMFILAVAFPVFLFGGTTVAIYLAAMAVWGFYYDFFNIGTIDFVERTGDEKEQVSDFGILSSFQGAGYLLAPFLGSLLLLFFHPGPKMLLMIAVPIAVSFIFYLIIVFNRVAERSDYQGVVRKSPLSFFREMDLWKKVWNILFSILLLTLLLNAVDAAIWTFGPIFSESVGKANGFSGGIFMTAYALPPILVGWIVGKIARRFGDAHTAQWVIAIGSVILMFIGFVSSPIFLIALIFAVSVFFSIGWPSIGAVYTEYIEKNASHRKEIETLQDLFTNFGDTSGPIAGGYMAQYLGFAHSFVALGFLGAIVAILLFIITPRAVAAID
ncbi:MAG: MFS transporter [Candidatus Staskawiczbacteria bacterium]|jgi:MFS family permease